MKFPKIKLSDFSFSKLSIRWKLAIYFLLFSFLMLAALWTFQYFVLDDIYVEIKKNTVLTYGDSLTQELSDNIYTESFIDKIDTVGAENDIYIAIFDVTDPETAVEYYRVSGVIGAYKLHSLSNEKLVQCAEAVRQNGSSVFFLKEDDNGEVELTEQRLGIGSANDINLVYATIAMTPGGMDYMIMLNSVITPVGSMVQTITLMLVILTFMLIVVSLILSFYASRIISRPIIQINNAAKNLIDGIYNVEIKGSSYREIAELNNTLSNVSIELGKVERLRRELIANVSHDLRTPLTMITGYAEMIRDLPGEDTPENMQVIIDEATRLSSLVKDLIDISVIQNGTTKVTLTTYNLTESIKNIFKRYSKLIEQNKFKLAFEYDREVYVHADDKKIAQVIYNLVNNAINYIGDDNLVIVKQTVSDGAVKIEVTDHGIGIPQDKLEHIWNRYYRVDKEHKRAVIGTGLGLSIVKSVLDLHKGTYGVESTLGKGSTFWFSLKTVASDDDISENTEDI